MAGVKNLIGREKLYTFISIWHNITSESQEFTGDGSQKILSSSNYKSKKKSSSSTIIHVFIFMQIETINRKEMDFTSVKTRPFISHHKKKGDIKYFDYDMS